MAAYTTSFGIILLLSPLGGAFGYCGHAKHALAPRPSAQVELLGIKCCRQRLYSLTAINMIGCRRCRWAPALHTSLAYAHTLLALGWLGQQPSFCHAEHHYIIISLRSVT